MKEFKRMIYRKSQTAEPDLDPGPTTCTSYLIAISQTDLDLSDSGIIKLVYFNCEGNPQLEEFSSPGDAAFTICVRDGRVSTLTIIVGGTEVTASNSTLANVGVCT